MEVSLSFLNMALQIYFTDILKLKKKSIRSEKNEIVTFKNWEG